MRYSSTFSDVSEVGKDEYVRTSASTPLRAEVMGTRGGDVVDKLTIALVDDIGKALTSGALIERGARVASGSLDDLDSLTCSQRREGGERKDGLT
jgi:hypothetical protein